MKKPTKDLFDDTTMTFGEHLEVLRIHLIRAIFGLVITVLVCLYYGGHIVDFVRRPIDAALAEYTELEVTDDVDAVKSWQDKWASELGLDTLKKMLFGSGSSDGDSPSGSNVSEGPEPHADTITVNVDVEQLKQALNAAAPSEFPVAPNSPASGESPPSRSKTVALTLKAPEFAQFQRTVEMSRQAVTLNVQEAFLTYIKVSVIAGLLMASPWIFYQLWLFVAAGLYPHERKYVYLYGSMSLGLFLVGAIFCFYAVFPFVLKFLLGFNATLKITPQIRLSEWISFAVMLPVMFGVSFQLPLVMLFLERISIFQAKHYREQRRMAILIIAILSMLLTPADPMSMLLMMFPLLFLYELGLKLCEWLPNPSPFDDDAETA